MAFGSMNSGDDSPMSDINVTPLVDVMLVLLIVFMITMPVLTHSIPLELPTASEQTNKQDKQPKDPLRLTIDANGGYYVGGDSASKVEIGEVESRLKAAKEQNENVIVAIAADKAVEYDYVNKALEAARQRNHYETHHLGEFVHHFACFFKQKHTDGNHAADHGTGFR
ncbi:biopolymer transport ExbD/TolR family protein, partial [Neisseria meningitidis 70021]